MTVLVLIHFVCDLDPVGKRYREAVVISLHFIQMIPNLL